MREQFHDGLDLLFGRWLEFKLPLGFRQATETHERVRLPGDPFRCLGRKPDLYAAPRAARGLRPRGDEQSRRDVAAEN